MIIHCMKERVRKIYDAPIENVQKAVREVRSSAPIYLFAIDSIFGQHLYIYASKL